LRRPLRVVEPVPPPATLSVPVIVGANVNEAPEFVMLSPTVWPLVVWEVVANVSAPVCADPPPFCTSDSTPVFPITPVPELYEIPVPALNEVLEILLLNVLQSVDAKYPFVEPLAAGMLIVFPARERVFIIDTCDR
jgi:hypothetical protein